MYKIYPNTLFVGQKIVYLPSCQSTNDVAAEYAAAGQLPEGGLVITDRQLAGRGQRGNQWQAEPGQNLTFSLVLVPTFLPAAEQFWLNVAVSLGITDALRPLLGASLRIKWPNDIYVGNRKLGGILIENTLQGYSLLQSIVGIGLNVNQTDFHYVAATSLLREAPHFGGYDLPLLLTHLCAQLEARYLQLRTDQRSGLRASYLQQLFRYQEEHHYVAHNERFRGTIVGIDAAGRLAMQVGDQLRHFAFKEVEFVL